MAGNIGADRYDVRLRFIRTVVAGYLMTILVTAVVPLVLAEPLPLELAGVVVAVSLLFLSLVRKLAPHGRADILAIALCALPLLGGLGTLVHGLTAQGWPVWALGLAIAFAGLYTFLCGRDFSFLGQYVLSLLATLFVTIPVLFSCSTGSTTSPPSSPGVATVRSFKPWPTSTATSSTSSRMRSESSITGASSGSEAQKSPPSRSEEG